MVVIRGPVQFQMGSPPGEAGRFPTESLHSQRIEGSFAIASKPVTVEQFRKFRKDYDYLPQYAPQPDCPVNALSWYMATLYCNWLSELEGIAPDQWCYQIDETTKLKPLASQRTKPKAKYLHLVGYRLPTEAEWEFACRAEAVTSRYFGESPDLLARYGWYIGNSRDRSWPVGSLKPNDFGLFDMHGNIWTWCQDCDRTSDAASPDREDDVIEVSQMVERRLRGGSFYNPPVALRAAWHNANIPTVRNLLSGMRIARTIVNRP
jgi:formylglycine-generating enzyme required for sulfatase activity